MNNKKYNIGAVSRITGLSTHAIRAWEKRYGVVKPARSGSNGRREYSQEDLELLLLLKKATSMGFNIGNIAHLDPEDLRSLLDEQMLEESDEALSNADQHTQNGFNRVIDRSLDAIQNYNSEKLEILISKAFMDFGNINTIEKIISPLTKKIGDYWSNGDIRIAQEHLASEIIRSSLLKVISKSHEYINSPVILVATPSGQMHDIGALITGSIAATEGWNVIYVGPNLPCEEIAGAINRVGARVVLLSIVYPGDDIKLNDELVNLRGFLEQDTVILVGGNAARNYLNTLNAINAEYIKDIGEFKKRLRELRDISF